MDYKLKLLDDSIEGTKSNKLLEVTEKFYTQSNRKWKERSKKI